MRGVAEEAKGRADKNSAIISHADLAAIRASAVIKSKADLEQEKLDRKTVRETAFSTGLARASKIKETDRIR